MFSFLPISILAYALNAGSILVDKILLQKSLPNPAVYAFYIGVLQLFVLLLIPFGFSIPSSEAIVWSSASGMVFLAALYCFYTSLKYNEASVAGAVTGSLNPLSALILGWIFLNQHLSLSQVWAVLLLVLGAFLLSFNLSHVVFNRKFWWMVLAGFLFGLSYVLLREAFFITTFLNGLIISRLAGGILALTFLIPEKLRQQILARKATNQLEHNRFTEAMLVSGQAMGAISAAMIVYAVSLASPAIVNSLFGAQYLVILAVALILYKKHPHLLGEDLTARSISQKVMGVIILSFGLYLLAQ